MSDERARANQETRLAWEQNAAYWDEQMAEGNHFVEVLTWPASERLLAIQPGEQVLDVACGNGLTSRRMATLGAQVTAFDFSAGMIEHARRRSSEQQAINYHVIDATDEAALLRLGEGRFDAALAAMALFDMAEIGPLFRALARLLKPGGRFVFSMMHPCFNNPWIEQVGEQVDEDGEIVIHYAIKVRRYLSGGMRRGLALREQPAAQWYFHRPLQELFGAAFAAGFALDGLEERSFPPDRAVGSNILSWGPNFSEIPPVLVARVRRMGGMSGESSS
jgi:2-polyprenyl-3-methyl-5-hydroxy-6-metoxy-1,4-benzoquinol methylase